MPNEASGAALALTLTLATLTELTRPRVPRSGVRPVASLHAPSPAAATAAASGIASSAAAAAAVASQAHLPRTGLRPAAAIAPSRPDDQDPKTSLYSYEMMGFGNKLALDWLFGPSATGRSRGYVHELYGYMPFGDGYGGGKVLPHPRTPNHTHASCPSMHTRRLAPAQVGSPPCPPWWWDWTAQGPYLSPNAFTPSGTWLPERPTSTCPPDCPPLSVDTIAYQPQ